MKKESKLGLYMTRALRIITIILLITVGCISLRKITSNIQPIDDITMDPLFKPYVKSYLSYKKKYLGIDKMREIAVRFFTLKSPVIGVCYKWDSGEKEVYIDPEFWFKSSEEDRFLLIVHELGHCDLGRDHDDPSSIMEPRIIGQKRFVKDKEYYLQELFGVAFHRDLSEPDQTGAERSDKSCQGIVTKGKK